MAKVWYNGLLEYNNTWDERNEAVLNAFPSHAYFVDNLNKMLNRKKIIRRKYASLLLLKVYINQKL